MEIETHPLEPFLPAKSKLLMLGSFPPQKKRWSMDFYYPNLNNDMWRIYGILFFNDKNHFLNSTLKSFCREQIIDFLNEKGIALFDTASSIRRLQDNASDKFLEVVEATDVAALITPSSFLKDAPCGFTGCLHHQEHIHWHWIRKQPLTGLCFRICRY